MLRIDLKVKGDADQLPSKDLTEEIVHQINAAVAAAYKKHGVPVPAPQSMATAQVSMVRAFLGSEPYKEKEGATEVNAHWQVELPVQ